MIDRNGFLTLLLLSACNTQKVVEDAQCSDAEQAMFMACVDAGCSASYSQDLAGTDSCKVDGGGTVVSVEAGGECGFTSSGSCYVVCDCPEGVSAEITVNAEDSKNDSEIQQSSDSTDAAITLMMEKIELLESKIDQLISSTLESEEKDRVIEDSINTLEDELNSKIDELIEIQTTEVTRLQNEITSLRSEILALELSNQRAQDDASQALSEIRALDARITSIENVQLSLSEDVLSLYDSVGLQLSRYEVDCNMNNLAAVQRFPVGSSWVEDKKCVLVEGVDINDMPMISISQVNTSWKTDYIEYIARYGGSYYYASWADEFKVGIEDGGLSPSSGMPDDTYLGPGSSFRYDPVTQEIYTSGHYKGGATDLTPNVYIVTVIGNQSFTSPY